MTLIGSKLKTARHQVEKNSKEITKHGRDIQEDMKNKKGTHL